MNNYNTMDEMNCIFPDTLNNYPIMKTQHNYQHLSAETYALLKKYNLKYDIDWLSLNGFNAFEWKDTDAEFAPHKNLYVDFVKQFNGITVIINYCFLENLTEQPTLISQDLDMSPDNPFLTDHVHCTDDLKIFLHTLQDMFAPRKKRANALEV